MIDYTYYTVAQVKKELKKRGLRLSGKKAVARLTDAVEKEAFHFFPKLPAELRHKIWLHALPRRRIVQVMPGPYGCSIQKPSLSAALDLMLVCKDAYLAASTRYRPSPTPPWCQARTEDEDRGWKINVNYEDDIFHLLDYPEAIEELGRGGGTRLLDPKLMKSISIPICEFEESLLDEGAFEQLLKLPNLEEVMLMQDLRPAPKLSNRPRSFGRQLMDLISPVEMAPPSWLHSYAPEIDSWFWQPLATTFSSMASSAPELQPLMNVKLFFSKVLE